jgi:predicted Zn-dependent peptidase
VEELRGVKSAPAPEAELRRAKDHLKGSLMLSLENTASRMSHIARQEIYFDRHFGLDETLEGIEKVTALDVQRVATDLLSDGALAGTVLGPLDGWEYPAGRLKLG